MISFVLCKERQLPSAAAPLSGEKSVALNHDSVFPARWIYDVSVVVAARKQQMR